MNREKIENLKKTLQGSSMGMSFKIYWKMSFTWKWFRLSF